MYKKPWLMMLYGAIYAVFSVFLALYVFPKQASVVMVFFTVMLSIVMAHKVIKYEKKTGLKKIDTGNRLKIHSRTTSFFIFLFLGYLIAFTSLVIFLPEKKLVSSFGAQIEIIKTPNEAIRGSPQPLLVVFNEKFRIILLCILFSFVYGAGTVFVFAWNAALVGTAIGSIARKAISAVALKVGSPNLAAYFSNVSVSLLKFLSFGIFEITGYFVVAIASGAIAIAVIRKDFKKKEFRTLLFNATNLMLISIVLILISSLIEVYVARPYFK